MPLFQICVRKCCDFEESFDTALQECVKDEDLNTTTSSEQGFEPTVYERRYPHKRMGQSVVRGSNLVLLYDDDIS